VRFVYNYDLPNVPENYVHRIGRTARAGRDGRAIAFVAPDEMGELKDVEKVLKMEIPIASVGVGILCPAWTRANQSGNSPAVAVVPAAGMTTTGARGSRAAVAALPQKPLQHAMRPSQPSKDAGILPTTVQPWRHQSRKVANPKRSHRITHRVRLAMALGHSAAPLAASFPASQRGAAANQRASPTWVATQNQDAQKPRALVSRASDLHGGYPSCRPSYRLDETDPLATV